MVSKFGIGKSHIITKKDEPMIYRWGVWSPYLTIFFSKIMPFRQVYHNHEGDFISFLLWGKFEEIYIRYNKRYRKFKTAPAINYVRAEDYHRVLVDKPTYTFLIMGRRKHDVSIYHSKRVYKFDTFIKPYR
jgi:hypothetical protein